MSNNKHLLVVCGKNKIRSLTAEQIYKNDPRFEIRSAGVSEKATHVISSKDVTWADHILCMETKHKERILQQFTGMPLPHLTVHDVPDEYVYVQPELIETLREKIEDSLHQ